ncbi:MAG TPA: DUF5672 family protein [Xanthomonadaceae bacterium]|jgi:hypothetical protein|nr:DUF5672 family protein [Xanthomonadaceae bacterium]
MTAPDARIDLREVSLVCVETRRHALAIAAMQRCMRQARFAECLLLSPQAPALPDGIRHAAIPGIDGIAGYSDFMVRRLGDCFGAKHVLVVQWDGFVLDAGCWDERFLDFDYIGAPWMDAQRTVGNGGFSLRSRRLCDALRELAPVSTHPEDLRICIDLRPQLEAHGVRFAPTALAERFAWEAPPPPFLTFGFHGLFNFHRVMSEHELVDFLRACDDDILYSVPARRLLKGAYATGFREAARAIHRRRMSGSPTMRLDALKLKAFALLRRGLQSG